MDLVIAFLNGAAVMVMELAAARVLGPHVGTSFPVWASVIGVMMAGLSVGYAAGGALADRRPERALLGNILIFSGVYMSVVPLSDEFVFYLLRVSQLDLRLIAILGCSILFLLPSVCLGMTTPFLIKFDSQDLAQVGRTAGAVSASSTFGSLVGTALAGFVLFSFAGTSQVLFFTGLLVVLMGLVLNRSGRALVTGTAAVVLSTFLLSQRMQLYQNSGVEEFDTPYVRGVVRDVEDEQGESLRFVTVDPFGAQAVVDLHNPERVVADYIRSYRLSRLAQTNPERILILGAGGYTLARDMLAQYPEAEITAVEIDAGMTTLSRRLLFLEDNERLHIHHNDGRVFLSSLDEDAMFDFIFVDTFGASGSPPFHLFTKEAFRLIADHLQPEGVVMMNVLTRTEDGFGGGFSRAAYWTMKESFSSVRALKLDSSGERQNLMFIASLNNLNEAIRQKFRGPEPAAVGDKLIFTDDFSPVDLHLNRLLFG